MLEIFITEKVLQKKLNENQRDLLVQILNFKRKAKQKSPEKNNKTKMFLKTYIIFLNVEKEFLMLLIAKYFQQKLKTNAFQARSLTILIPKY